MTASKRNRYRKGELKAQIREALGSDKMTYTLDDGTDIEFPWPIDWSTEQKRALKQLDANADDEEEYVRVILGDEDFETFTAGDGDAMELSWMIQDAVEMVQDIRAGRKRPTRS